MKRNKLLSMTLIFVLSLTLFSQVAIASQPLDGPEPECNPRAARLAEWMGEKCELLMTKQAQGVGFGVIMQAYAQSLAYPELRWEALLARNMSKDGHGWGEIKQAIRLAVLFALNVDDLLASRAEGPGKPPWAGGPKKDKEKPGKPEKPDKPKESDEPEEPDKAGKGPPHWARPGKPPKAKP
jgi:hypothetical protein